MSTPLTIDTARRDDGRLVLTAAGEIDMSNIDAFHQSLTSAADVGDAELVIVDLGAVDYLDSGAISALVAHADRITVIANPLLMSALRISGLAELVHIEPAAG